MIPFFSIPFFFIVFLIPVACAKTDDHPVDTTAITTTRGDSSTTTTSSSSGNAPPTQPAGSTGSAVQTQPPGGVATPPTAWVVTERGIGNLRAGMTLADARAVVPGFTVPVSRDSAACTYGKASSLPSGVFVMVEGGKVVRVEVRRGDIATSTGAHIGDSEERIKTLYPNVTVSPHKYTRGGHYLTVAPDGDSRIIFETDGKRVVNYRAGHRPQVEYVEGCS